MCKEADRPRKSVSQVHETLGFKRGSDPRAVVAQYDGECSRCGGEIVSQYDVIVPDTSTRVLGGVNVEVKNGWRHMTCE